MTAADNSATKPPRLDALDVLRLIAVLAVAFYHFGFWGPPSHGTTSVALPGAAPFAMYGFLGVSIFFVISGFVIAYSAEGRTATGFAIARFARIYPTFIVCMTLTAIAVFMFGAPHFEVTLKQWILNWFIAAPSLGAPYIDSAYWSLVVEIVFYAWVALFIALGWFPRKIDTIVLVWLALSMLNELTIDAVIVEKIFLADDSGFFATGLLIYEFYKGRRGAMLCGLFALSVGTATFQAVHKLGHLTHHAASPAEEWTVAAICLMGIAAVFIGSRMRRVPLPAGLTLAAGGITYPLYLLHQQLGYTMLNWIAPQNIALGVVGVLASIAFLSWAIWRYVEPPAQRVTKQVLGGMAARLGWPLKAPSPSVAIV